MTKRYPWYDNLQFLAMLLMAAAVPLYWRLGLWTAISLGMVSILKVVVTRKVGNPALTSRLRWALMAPIVYWLMLLISMLWTSDLATGWTLLCLKAVLLIFPVSFLISDTSYLTRNHIRALGYALLVAVCAAFLYFAVKAGISMLQGTKFLDFKNSFYTHENKDLHHAYIAIYALTAMVFVYHELSCHWHEMRLWRRCLLIVTLPMLVCYVVMVNSRAGMLAMGMTCLACVVHLAVTRRSWILGLGVALLLAGSAVGAMKLLPGYVDRIKSTVENVEDDARTKINRCNWHAYVKSPVIGYGAGDYHERQVAQYAEDEFSRGEKAKFNAHNQYMESLLAAGIPGLLALLFFLTMPFGAAVWQRKKLFTIALLTVIVMFNLLFESMFERQMGLLFIGNLYGIMVLIMSVEENKFVQMGKS